MNILFLAYEVESYCIASLSKLYNNSNKTYILNADFWTFINNKNYYHIYNNNCNEYVNLENDYMSLHDGEVDNKKVLSYLMSFEAEYRVTISELINTDPIMQTGLHDRDIYSATPVDIKLKWIALIVKRCLKILDEFKPDLIITLDNNYLVKNIMYCIAQKKGIPFLSIMNSRIGDKFIGVDNFGLGTSQCFLDAMTVIGNKHLEKSKKFKKDVILKNLPVYNSHKKILAAYKEGSFIKDLKFVASSIVNDARSFLLLKTYYRGRFKSNYLDSMYFKTIWYYLRNYIFKKHLVFKKIKFLKKIEENLKFYYFSMHVIPESSVLTLSKDYKEEAIIIDVALKLPVNVFLVVKENLTMLSQGERSFSFYRKMAQLHNVILIDPSCNSLELVKNSLGVISLSGTTMFEAAFVSKRAISVGIPEYNILSNVEKYNKYTTIFPSIDLSENTTNLEKYIQTVFEVGQDIDMNYLLYEGTLKMNGYKYKNEIKKLKKLFDAQIKAKEYTS
jgi:hypothetical protein